MRFLAELMRFSASPDEIFGEPVILGKVSKISIDIKAMWTASYMQAAELNFATDFCRELTVEVVGDCMWFRFCGV
jgi:hypothetical protein